MTKKKTNTNSVNGDVKTDVNITVVDIPKTDDNDISIGIPSPEMKEVPLTPPITDQIIEEIATGKRIKILEEIKNNKNNEDYQTPPIDNYQNIDDEAIHLSPTLEKLKKISFKNNVLLLSILILPFIVIYLAFALGKSDSSKESIIKFMGKVTVFLILIYFSWEVFTILSLMIPKLMLRVANWLRISPELEIIKLISSLKCINKAVRNIFTLLATGFFYIILFDSNKTLELESALKSAAKGLDPSFIDESKQIGLGKGIEKIISTFHSIFLCIVPEQFLMAAISNSYTKNVRVRVESNDVIRLQTVINDFEEHFHDCKEFCEAMETLKLLTKLDDGEYMTADNADKCIRNASDNVSSIIIKSLEGFDSNRQLVINDFENIKFNSKMFPRQYKDAFEILDTNENGSIGKDELSRCILHNFLTIERNNHSIRGAINIVGNLDDFLFSFSLLIGIMIAVISASSKGLEVIHSFSTSVIGLSFLLNSVAARIFDILIFVFVCHNYDAHDRVKINGKITRIHEIMIFTTTAIDEETGALVYMPSSDIKGKNIENMDRKKINNEKVFMSVDANFEIYKIIEMKKKINGILKTRDDDYGECKINFTKDESEYFICFDVSYRSVVPLLVDRSIGTKRCMEIDEIIHGVMNEFVKN